MAARMTWPGWTDYYLTNADRTTQFALAARPVGSRFWIVDQPVLKLVMGPFPYGIPVIPEAPFP